MRFIFCRQRHHTFISSTNNERIAIVGSFVMSGKDDGQIHIQRFMIENLRQESNL